MANLHCLSLLFTSALAQLSATPLQEDTRSTGFMQRSRDISDHLVAAMDEVLGQGHGTEKGKLEELRNRLQSTFLALPKNDQGRIQLPALDRIVHRYFLHAHGIALKGFEPYRALNGTEFGATELLQERVPAFVEKVLTGHFAQNGFALEDVVAMVATLEHFITDEHRGLLEKSYVFQSIPEGVAIHEQELVPLLRNFLAHLQSSTKGESLPPDWALGWAGIGSPLPDLVDTEVMSLKYTGRDRSNPFRSMFSFSEILRSADNLARKFSGSVMECSTLRKHFASQDPTGSGRVLLKDFYAVGVIGTFQLVEKPSYLRDLGMLDESSKWHGPRVLTANYIEAIPNCAIDTPLYRVCCPSSCESILGEIEANVKMSHADPVEILKFIQTHGVSEWRPVSEELVLKLQSIASHHGGMVPIHGRLFAQWLHYYLPQDCPFPHLRGDVSTLTPSQYGDYLATYEDFKDALSDVATQEAFVSDASEDIWLSQWSHVEELIPTTTAVPRPYVKSVCFLQRWWVLVLAGPFVIALVIKDVLLYAQFALFKREKSLMLWKSSFHTLA